MARTLALFLPAIFLLISSAWGKFADSEADVNPDGSINLHVAHDAEASPWTNSSYDGGFSVDAAGQIEQIARASCVGVVPGCDYAACAKSKDCCNHNNDFQNQINDVRNEYNAKRQNRQTKEQGGWYDCAQVLKSKWDSSNLKRACLQNPCMECMACASGQVNFCQAFYSQNCRFSSPRPSPAPRPQPHTRRPSTRPAPRPGPTPAIRRVAEARAAARAARQARKAKKRGGKGLLMEAASGKEAKAEQEIGEEQGEEEHEVGDGAHEQEQEALMRRRSGRDDGAESNQVKTDSLDQSVSSKEC